MAGVPDLCQFDWPAPAFELPAVDGRRYSLADLRGEKGTLIAFICNHCPYVLAIADRIAREGRDLQAAGIGVVAINANDTQAYPADSFDNMKVFATESGFSFPYLFDETQEVAKAYQAVCTPDFFGFNADLGLQYRGRLDASRTQPVASARRDLYEAMLGIAETGQGPADQLASMGCTIKWRPGNAPD